jgi:rhodanese-related sulfurtransferase
MRWPCCAAKGYKARRMEDGFPEWKAAGLPVEEASLE